jgi:hypothetical protein
MPISAAPLHLETKSGTASLERNATGSLASYSAAECRACEFGKDRDDKGQMV